MGIRQCHYAMRRTAPPTQSLSFGADTRTQGPAPATSNTRGVISIAAPTTPPAADCDASHRLGSTEVECGRAGATFSLRLYSIPFLVEKLAPRFTAGAVRIGWG